MTPVNLLTDSINTLWYYVYGLIAGWGVTFTALIAVLVILVVRSINQAKKIKQLESRLIVAERDYNLTVNKWTK